MPMSSRVPEHSIHGVFLRNIQERLKATSGYGR
jgi:hypothetical protein